jgi:hypothetical protein
MVAEGIWVQKEKLVFTKEKQSIELANPNVIRSKLTDISISDDEGRTFKEGTDYAVENGDVDPYRGAYGVKDAPAIKPFIIRRIPAGSIPLDEPVFASYDYIPLRKDAGSDLCACPSEPQFYEWQENLYKKIAQSVKPKLFFINRDEPMRMSTDSRCIKSGRNNAELFAEDVRKSAGVIWSVDPEIKILMWADALLPHQNALMFAGNPILPAVEMIPKNIVLVPWFYYDEAPFARYSLEYLMDKGFRIIAGASRVIGNATWWSSLAWSYKVGGSGSEVIGLVATPWEGRQNTFDEFARYSWTHNKPVQFDYCSGSYGKPAW